VPLTVTWTDAAVRIALTVMAAAAIGFDRGVEGYPAGMRTTLLVALAVCLSMLQANWLMNTVGKTPDSFVVLDLMRLPLGILTGVGFIGGGVILKRDDAIRGLTTAATLWFVTVIGLCFGGGQNALGVAGALIGLGVLRGLKLIERRLRQERPSELRIRWNADDFDSDSALATIGASTLRVSNIAIKHNVSERIQELRCTVRRWSPPDEPRPPFEVLELVRRPGVLEWEWKE
jgi:putative Mg2+ transporter-C (MgtC) family protein